MAAHEVLLLLDVDVATGLSAAEAERRRDAFGPNELPGSPGISPIIRILRQLGHPLVYILLVAGAVTGALGEYVDTAVIFGVVLVNVLVGFIQESRAEAALDVLGAMATTTAIVRRGGHEQTVGSEDVVPGDVVLVQAGDKVPADLRLVQVARLHADESMLTGESDPVVKDEVALPAGTAVSDRRNMVYSGTLITEGNAVGVAVATGSETELGEIHRLLGSVKDLATPLTVKLARFSGQLTVLILALAVATFGIGMARGQDLVTTFTAAIALAVGAIPEGLPAAVTITLAIGVSRMARRGAIVRRLPSVETLGSTTVICTDKTGTLTENQMTVRRLWMLGQRFTVTGAGYGPDGAVLQEDGTAATADGRGGLRQALLAGALCNDAALARTEGRWTVVGDPTEGALLAEAAKGGIDREAASADYPRADVVPFDSEHQYMATLHQVAASGSYLILVKGAPERVVPLCDRGMRSDGAVEELDAEEALDEASQMAAAGLRVLATASMPLEDPRDFESALGSGEMALTGFHGMQDPPRPAAQAAVAACRSASVEVKMITGDHIGTAAAVARQVGILEADPGPGDAITGAELQTVPAHRLAETVRAARVFARVSPEQKLTLIEALQSRGEIVAMTGDGVNDAPALRQADIGVAMGRSGTEVAKEAADMVLTDDDFATIEAAVEEGRTVFDNLTKFIVWTIPTNMGEGLVILAAVVSGAVLPVLPTQILWINMTTAVALGLMLAFEPKEPGIMERRPRSPAQPLLTGSLMVRSFLVSALLVAGAWGLFEWESALGAGLAEARTGAVNLFVVVETFYLLSCRSLTRPLWAKRLAGNPWVTGGIAVQVAAQAALTYLPGMNALFQTAPIGARAWLLIIAAGAVTYLAAEGAKRWLSKP